ncbi:MAG: radical SAM protein [Bdellovibrionales bacterium]|nr:radical SAM protein [Bdellovibrionales bacterium]
MSKIYRYVYGPLNSRRQGVALGVDPFKQKICSFDCVYCEVGKTEITRPQANHFATPEEIVSEVTDALREHPETEVICFAGMGEPTLHKKLGEMIDMVRETAKRPISVITNSAHLHRANVVEALLKADMVLPSLNSARDESYQAINRPVGKVKAEDVVENLVKFRELYKGEIWLEVFVCPGVNDSQEDLKALSFAVERIKPERVQVNTLQRPGTEDWVKPMPKDDMNLIAEALGPKAEVIATGIVNIS